MEPTLAGRRTSKGKPPLAGRSKKKTPEKKNDRCCTDQSISSPMVSLLFSTFISFKKGRWKKENQGPPGGALGLTASTSCGLGALSVINFAVLLGELDADLLDGGVDVVDLGVPLLQLRGVQQIVGTTREEDLVLLFRAEGLVPKLRVGVLLVQLQDLGVRDGAGVGQVEGPGPLVRRAVNHHRQELREHGHRVGDIDDLPVLHDLSDEIVRALVRGDGHPNPDVQVAIVEEVHQPVRVPLASRVRAAEEVRLGLLSEAHPVPQREALRLVVLENATGAHVSEVDAVTLAHVGKNHGTPEIVAHVLHQFARLLQVVDCQELPTPCPPDQRDHPVRLFLHQLLLHCRLIIGPGLRKGDTVPSLLDTLLKLPPDPPLTTEQQKVKVRCHCS
eukprot:Hpha_TRINITY_DN16293_c1_g1::TRINITY_DN16293_c1_g1_i1::g.14358::m.14358